jgi:Right handed beta helix region
MDRFPLLALAATAALAACGGRGGPTAPSAPVTLVVAGQTALGVGEKAQLKATTGAGEDVTAQATWTSNDRTVATVAPGGLATGVRPGPVQFSATYRNVSARLDVTVAEIAITSPGITSCGAIALPGNYRLDDNLATPVPAGPCLAIRVSGVHLDCGDHTVTGIYVSGVTDVAVSHCTFVTESVGSGQSFAIVENSSGVTVDHNRLSGVIFRGGGSNRLLENTIDGGYDGAVGGTAGQDDGVVIVDEVNDVIEGNTIANVWDAGIEGLDVVANTVISNNVIVNAGAAGISSYWCTNWTGNTVSGNTVSRSPNLVFFNHQSSTSKCQVKDTPLAFANNRITGNAFRDRKAGGAEASMYFYFPTAGADEVFNNLIQDNDMGTAPGPYVVPEAGFIDGGGNICGGFFNAFCGGGRLAGPISAGLAKLARKAPYMRMAAIADRHSDTHAGLSRYARFFSRRRAATAPRPVPRSSSVAGSGTGDEGGLGPCSVIFSLVRAPICSPLVSR